MTTLAELNRAKRATLIQAQQIRYDQQRGSAHKRGYGVGWRAHRAAYLRDHPICCVPGCNRPATDVDHIVPRRRGGSDEDANLQPLCHAHHSAKTAREDGGYGHGA